MPDPGRWPPALPPSRAEPPCPAKSAAQRALGFTPPRAPACVPRSPGQSGGRSPPPPPSDALRQARSRLAPTSPAAAPPGGERRVSEAGTSRSRPTPIAAPRRPPRQAHPGGTGVGEGRGACWGEAAGPEKAAPALPWPLGAAVPSLASPRPGHFYARAPRQALPRPVDDTRLAPAPAPPSSGDPAAAAAALPLPGPRARGMWSPSPDCPAAQPRRAFSPTAERRSPAH